MSQNLNYHNPPQTRSPTCPALPFWSIYVACAAISFLWLTDLLETLAHGRPGDVVVKTFELASVFVTAFAAAFLYYLRLRRLRPAPALLTATFLGLASPFPGYIFLRIFF